MHPTRPIRLFLCGDVMIGRGIDQILSHPGSPVLFEPWVDDARHYVQLAESVHGPIPRPVDFTYVWGDALTVLRQSDLDARIINLETSLTRSDDCWPDKEVNYRCHPGNVGCLREAGIDCCCLANNHVLDWGYAGLAETLHTLDQARLAHAGAGRDAGAAAAPAVLDLPGQARLLVFALGSPCSGIPWDWAASSDRAGVNFLEDLSEDTARRVAGHIRRRKRPGDLALASLHWGGNWGHDIPQEHIHFAHRLIEDGVDLVHGHSSHHVKTFEIHQEHLILYGCGDFLNDYEGIGGYERFRSDLTLMYLVQLDPQGRLLELRLVPLQVKRFRLNHASEDDTRWLRDYLKRHGAPLESVHMESRAADRLPSDSHRTGGCR